MLIVLFDYAKKVGELDEKKVMPAGRKLPPPWMLKKRSNKIQQKHLMKVLLFLLSLLWHRICRIIRDRIADCKMNFFSKILSKNLHK